LEIVRKWNISTGLETEGKSREDLTENWQTKSRIRGGDSGDYDYNYDDYYDIKHTGRLQQYPTNPGHSQTDITFYSPVRARISDRIRVPWFCAGTVLAVVSSATGPTECLKY